MLVQPQPAATVCELDLVQRAIRSWRWAQTLDSKQWPETLDCAYAHVNGHSWLRSGSSGHAPRAAPRAPVTRRAQKRPFGIARRLLLPRQAYRELGVGTFLARH